MHKVSVYKDRHMGTWWWQCHVPLCGRQEWIIGSHAACVKTACGHLSRHFTTGYGR